MSRLDEMHIFARVAELGSFTRAAESLGLPKASASTAVQQLESSLGTRLLHRTTRRVELTHDGRTYYERCKDLLADMDELHSMFQQAPQSLRGRLRIDMPIGIARHQVMPRLPEFLEMYPQIEVEFSCTDRRVDLIREGFDCVLRCGALADSNLIARQLGFFPILNLVSPAYLEKYGEPKTLDDLATHQLIHYAPILGTKALGFEYWDGNAYQTISMQGAMTVNNSEAYEMACLAGLGIIQTPAAGMQKWLSRGVLVEILPQYKAEPMPVSLLYATRRNLSKRVQIFMKWVSGILAPSLEKTAL